MKKFLPLILILLLISINNGLSQNYYTVSSPSSYVDGVLYIVNPVDASVIESMEITMGGYAVSGCNGLARNPLDNELYIVVKEGNTRSLATLDPTGGTATLIGSLSDNFAGIAFATDGTLYGITGDGGTNPSTIYTINTNDASSALLIDVEDGSDGETIAFNSTDGLIYRYGGGTLWQTIDPVTLEVVDAVLSGAVANASHCLTHRPATNDFIFIAEKSFYTVTTGGTLTLLATNTFADNYKGIVAVDVVTAVQETYREASHIQVFPNPADAAVSIQFENMVAALTIEVYQSNGQLIRTIETGGVDQLSIDLSGLPSGIYNVAIREDGKYYSKRFVKE